MGAFIENYVAGCDICQRYKHARHPKSTLQPQETPSKPWEIIRVDHITHLPKSNGYDAISVYVDHATGQSHLIPCHTTTTAEGQADIHYREIFRLHGLPRVIHSDRGPQFASRFMRALLQRLGI